MRIIVQKVKHAKCIVDTTITGQIGQGFLLLVGFEQNDTRDCLDKMARKVSALRIFEDSSEKMNLSLKDVEGSILSISQFTLYADASHGNRPSFINAMKSEQAIELYNEFNQILENKYHNHVEKGIFGAHMLLDFVNDGPCTILLDTKDF